MGLSPFFFSDLKNENSLFHFLFSVVFFVQVAEHLIFSWFSAFFREKEADLGFSLCFYCNADIIYEKTGLNSILIYR